MKRPHKHVIDVLGNPKKAPAADLEAPRAGAPIAVVHRPPGRPAGPETSSKITVVFYDRQTRALDDLCHDIYGRTRTKITRTQLIRGVIDAVLDAVDLTEATSEIDIRERVASRLKKG